jgi:hypothetical protein
VITTIVASTAVSVLPINGPKFIWDLFPCTFVTLRLAGLRKSKSEMSLPHTGTISLPTNFRDTKPLMNAFE